MSEEHRRAIKKDKLNRVLYARLLRLKVSQLVGEDHKDGRRNQSF